jgi:tRNA(fMet)-specific endonuclease VapC
MIECTVDSTTIIDILRGRPQAILVLTRFAEIGLSHTTLGELILGVLKSSDRGELNKTIGVVRGMTLLHGDGDTAVMYAGIRQELERLGNMIPQNDIWIAAASIQANVPLVTRDQHFRRISGLKLVEY